MIDIEEEASAIHALATLVGVLAAGGDADTTIEGIRLVMIEISDRAASILDHDRASREPAQSKVIALLRDKE
jgi:hypothetical protein